MAFASQLLVDLIMMAFYNVCTFFLLLFVRLCSFFSRPAVSQSLDSSQRSEDSLSTDGPQQHEDPQNPESLQNSVNAQNSEELQNSEKLDSPERFQSEETPPSPERLQSEEIPPSPERLQSEETPPSPEQIQSEETPPSPEGTLRPASSQCTEDFPSTEDTLQLEDSQYPENFPSPTILPTPEGPHPPLYTIWEEDPETLYFPSPKDLQSQEKPETTENLYDSEEFGSPKKVQSLGRSGSPEKSSSPKKPESPKKSSSPAEHQSLKKFLGLTEPRSQEAVLDSPPGPQNPIAPSRIRFLQLKAKFEALTHMPSRDFSIINHLVNLNKGVLPPLIKDPNPGSTGTISAPQLTQLELAEAYTQWHIEKYESETPPLSPIVPYIEVSGAQATRVSPVPHQMPRSKKSPTGPSSSPPSKPTSPPSSSYHARQMSDAVPPAIRAERVTSTASEVINRVVITDPSEDLARERARVAESQPASEANETISDSRAAEPTRKEYRSPSNATPEHRHSIAAPRRQDFSNEKPSKRDTKLGDYHIGQTLGEGEFGKVKLGWKKSNGVQVAIKLIRREKLDNQARLAKVYREIAILRELDHPNIVRLHEMVETERTIGIILEYASGGELFDYILHERYLKDPAARRLFAQLVSGVGYLHKKGIIHRDLKLENLLLDRNHNIIITDFGFANTFDPTDELGEKVESRLNRRSFVKKHNLETVQPNGFRRGDLMATSCGSPCYAAPELVVSDGIYTGRKVDVWSCGVILYAMLAGYLPFDDDPANPDGDNINLLYKYIVTTPLSFPDYVTPHAKDLLRRILVPDPRKRADLFEVARHSWLGDFAHVVEFITSDTTTSADIAKAIVSADGHYGLPTVNRSSSVRESNRSPAMATVGGLISKAKGKGSPDSEKNKTPRDQKRNTVQVEYVPPQSENVRGSPQQAPASQTPAEPRSSQKTKARYDSQGPVPVQDAAPAPSVKTAPSTSSRHRSRQEPIPPRTTSENFAAQQTTRPSTGGSMSGVPKLPPSRGSYGLPVAATTTSTSAQGYVSQPPNNQQYTVSSPTQSQQRLQATKENYDQTQQQQKFVPEPQEKRRSHRRSNTLTNLGDKMFGRSNSTRRSKTDRTYPPTSMKPVGSQENSQSAIRPSQDSSRVSSGHSRKSSDAPKRHSRRFSFLPKFGNREQHSSSASQSQSQYASGSRPVTEGQYEGTQQVTQNGERDFSGVTNTTMATTAQSIAAQRAPSVGPQYPIENRPSEYTTQTAQQREWQRSHNNYDPYEQKPHYLKPNNRRFQDAYDQGRPSLAGGRVGVSGGAGSSGLARRAMDFFRRRRKDEL